MKLSINFFKRCFSTTKVQNPKICIVGSGPAGFYAAQHLAKQIPNVSIDIFEKLPVPFGLVRFGVAPDHPEVKNVIHTFSKTAEIPNVNFIGNVNLGRDVHLRELKEAYHIVLLTYGAEENKRLGIPGEGLNNVIPARNIVGWYNGLPFDKDLKINLNEPSVTIIGQGNVAIDVARILLTPIDSLRKTDITQYALETLMSSKVKEVHLIGRRGPLQAAFTIKELREMLKLQDVRTVWRKEDFIGIKEVLTKLERPRKRLTELMLKSLSESPSKGNKLFKPIFLRSPLEFKGEEHVKEAILGINKLEGDDNLRQKAILTEDREIVKCGLAITSIGYKGTQVDSDVPFDENSGTVRNVNGKISDGLYTTGWLGTGPTGVILTTMSNSFGIAERIKQDLAEMKLEEKPGKVFINELLTKKGVRMVSWSDWLKINKYEEEEGKKYGKPREKIVNIEKMLEIID